GHLAAASLAFKHGDRATAGGRTMQVVVHHHAAAVAGRGGRAGGGDCGVCGGRPPVGGWRDVLALATVEQARGGEEEARGRELRGASGAPTVLWVVEPP